MNSYQQAKKRYEVWGINVEAALETLAEIPVSIQCWQGDDLGGFEDGGKTLTGGIQATGNYPGKSRSAEELMADFQEAICQVPGKKRINLHASYAVFPDAPADRDALLPHHFTPWVEFAKKLGIGIDFNPTFFSHPMVKDGLTLASPDEKVRAFWVRHGIACRRISAYIARELNDTVLCNIWIPDGLKDVPGDRFGPRMRLKECLDEIFAEKLDGIIDCVESKLFGIGVESYTVGAAEFYLAYAANKPGVYVLLDNGHFHPAEFVSDKISSMLVFFDKLPLHVTRPVRWDSDHVVLLEDEIKEIAKEIVRCDALDKVLIGLDFFDASINRIAAWVIGARNMQKALLFALLQPNETLRRLQNEARFTELMVIQEELKTCPFGEIWGEYCRRQNTPQDGEWYALVRKYEENVLNRRC